MAANTARAPGRRPPDALRAQGDLVWLDGEFEHTPEGWRFDEIRELIRNHQPGALVNDRCLGHGDFVTPEQ